MSDYFYRYTELKFCDAFGIRIDLFLNKFKVIKRTPKGVWIESSHAGDISCICDMRRFVLLTAKKRFACPTKKEAMESFIARKRRQIKILNTHLDNAKESLEVGRQELENMEAWDKINV